MDILFLGTSSGKAIPRHACQCRQCRSRDPRDRRLRSSILIEGKILVDCGPDIKEQMLNVKCLPASATPKALQAGQMPARSHQATALAGGSNVIITHKHEDHIAGLDKITIDKEKVFYPQAGQKLKIDGLKIEAFRAPHSKIIPTIGLIIAKDFIYLPDCGQLTRKVRKNLEPAKLLILDGSVWERDFGGHQAIKKQLKILQRFKILGKESQVYFTHNGHTRIPHRELERQIQTLGGPQYHLAYDGLKLDML